MFPTCLRLVALALTSAAPISLEEVVAAVAVEGRETDALVQLHVGAGPCIRYGQHARDQVREREVINALANAEVTETDLSAALPILAKWRDERENQLHRASERDELRSALLARNPTLDHLLLDAALERAMAQRPWLGARNAAPYGLDHWPIEKRNALQQAFEKNPAQFATLDAVAELMRALATERDESLIRRAATTLFATWKGGARSVPPSSESTFYARVGDAVIVGASNISRDHWLMVDASGIKPAPPARCENKMRAQVQRSEVIAPFENPNSRPGGRFVPAFAAGHVIGFKLLATEPGGLIERVGFCDGDVVVAVGDVSVASADGAAQALKKYRDAASVTFSIRRRGKPFALTLEAVP